MTQMANERGSLHVDCEQQADIILFKIRHHFESTFHFFEQPTEASCLFQCWCSLAVVREGCKTVQDIC